MKFKKPSVIRNYDAAMDFIDVLPDEFEILGPGEVAVKWPEGLTRDELEHIAARGSWNQCTDALFKLAAIAPERKKRKVALWIKPNGDQVWCGSCGEGWRKVGECEIEE